MARHPKPWYRKARRSWYVTIDGVQHSLGPEKLEAYERFHRLVLESKTPETRDLELTTLTQHFLDWVERNRASATHRWYSDLLREFVELHRTFTLADLRPHHVELWATQQKSLSINSHRNRMRAVKRCFRWGVVQDYLRSNPIDGLQIPCPTSREVYVYRREFDDLLTDVPDPCFRDLLVTTCETGCRPQESLRVEARHVDLPNSR